VIVVDQRIEQVLRELRRLAGKKPLSQEDLNRAKVLMTTLRQMGFTNIEVSELTDGGWREPTVKLYTRGAKIDDPSPKKRATELLKQLVSKDLTLDDVERALSATRRLEEKGLSLDTVSSFLGDVERSKGDLTELLKTYGELRSSGLTIEQLGKILSYNVELETLGVTLEGLTAISQASKQHGRLDDVLKAIVTYGKLRSIEDSLTKLEGDKAEQEGAVIALTNDVKSLEDRKRKIEHALSLYDSLEGEGFGFDVLKGLKAVSDKYGGAGELLGAVNAYSNLAELQKEISKLQAEKTRVEAKLKGIEADHAHLQHVIQICETLLYKYGFSASAIETLHNVSRRYGGAFHVLEAIGKYNQLVAIESEIQKLSVKRAELESGVMELEKQAQSIRGLISELERSAASALGFLSAKLTEGAARLGEAFTNAIAGISSSFKNSQESLSKAYSDTLTVIEERLPTTLRTLGQIDEKIRRAKDLSITLDLIERPAEVKEPTGKVMASALAHVIGLETYIEVNKDKIADWYSLKSDVSDLRDRLTGIVRVELGRTQAGS
jgi:predicted  nucleic acid-binding Zn-ribbon protein